MTLAGSGEKKDFRRHYWQSRYAEFLKDAAKSSSDAWRLRAICYMAWPLIFNRVMAFYESFFVSKLLERACIELKGRAVLDLGCGTGRWCHFFDHFGAQITGLDISEEMVAYNRKQFPQWEFIASDISKMPYPGDFFDFVNAAIVLEYVPNAEKKEVLKELFRILKPGGSLLVLDPVAAGEGRENDESSCLSVAEWERLLRNAGFEILAQMPLHAYPLVGVYRRFSKMLGTLIKALKGQGRTHEAAHSSGPEKAAPASAGNPPAMAWRHRLYYELDQWILRILACFSLLLEGPYLKMGGKGSHQLFLLRKPLPGK